MRNICTKGRVLSLVKHIGSGGVEVTPHDTWVSGYNVQMVNIASGRISLATKLAGEDIAADIMKVVVMSGVALPVQVSGQPVKISGQPVKISGQTVQIAGTVDVSVSNQPIKISGQSIRFTDGFSAVKISGQIVKISGQVIDISDQPVKISGQLVNTSGNVSYFQSGTGNIRSSGQATTINAAQFKSGLHGISGRQLLTNILDSDIRASYPPSLWRIMLAVGNEGQLTARITNSGGISGHEVQTVTLNEGTDLKSGSAYIFDLINQSGDEMNLQYNTSAPVHVIRIQEITAGTQ